MAAIVLKKKELPAVNAEYAKTLGLDSAEWKRILDALGRFPNEYEALVFAMNWTEETSGKTSSILLNAIRNSQKEFFGDKVLYSKRTASRFVTVGQNLAVTMSLAESNLATTYSPSYGSNFALDKVIDELTADAAQPQAFADLLRLGDPELSRTHKALQKIIGGISNFTNIYGSPIARGDTYFHPAFSETLYINIGALGITETGYLQREKPKLHPGTPILFLGAKLPTVFADEQPKKVFQMADPFLKQRMQSLCLQALKDGLLEEIFPLNNGGVGCAVVRMANHFKYGVQLYLDKLPTELKKFSIENVLLNQPLGNFLAVLHPSKHRDASDFFTRNGIPSVTVGFLADIDDVELIANHFVWAAVPYQIAGTGFSQAEIRMTKSAPMLRRNENDREKYDEDLFAGFTSVEDAWIDIITNPNLCSRNILTNNFDQDAGLKNVSPAGANAAVVLLPKKETEKQTALALTIDSNCLYTSRDTYLGTVYSIAEAMQNLTVSGAEPLGISYCLNIANPEDPLVKIQMSEATRAVDDTSVVLNIPVLSETIVPLVSERVAANFAVPAIMMAGLISDTELMRKPYFNVLGELVFVIGVNRPLFLASEYVWYTNKQVTGKLPEINLTEHKHYCTGVLKLINRGLVQTVHDVSTGGLALALSECCMFRPKKPLGVELEILDDPVFDGLRREIILFNESPGRFIVSVKPQDQDEFVEFCARNNLNLLAYGKVSGREINVKGTAEFNMPLATLKRTWLNGLNYMFNIGERENI